MDWFFLLISSVPLSFPATRGQICLLSGSNHPLLNHLIGQTLLFPLTLTSSSFSTNSQHKEASRLGSGWGEFSTATFYDGSSTAARNNTRSCSLWHFYTPNAQPLAFKLRGKITTRGQQLATTGRSQRQRNGLQYQAARPTFGGPDIPTQLYKIL